MKAEDIPKFSPPFREPISEALSPLVDGRKLIAAKVYYLYTTDDATVDVGTLSITYSQGARDQLAALIREEEKLAALPHADHRFSFVRNQPTRH